MFFKTAFATLLLATGFASADEPVEYGVDVSFPIHHDRVTENYAWLEWSMTDWRLWVLAIVGLTGWAKAEAQELIDKHLSSLAVLNTTHTRTVPVSSLPRPIIYIYSYI